MRTNHLLSFVCCISVALFAVTGCGNGPGEDVETCTVPSDCEEGQDCRGERCVDTCESDDDCGEGTTCELDGICATTCEGDGGCDSGETCDSNANVCWPEGQSIDSCEEDSECAGNEYCGDGTCLPHDCENDEDCVGEANVCYNNRCRTGCRKDEDCEEGKKCGEFFTCVQAGCSAGECPDHQDCKTDKDPPVCEFNGECDSEDDDDVCQGYADQMGTMDPWICEPDAGECVPKPACNGDDECASNEICRDDRKYCVEGCRCTDGCARSCSAGEVCNKDKLKCVQGCQTDADCKTAEGDVCVDQQCRVSCSSADDCDRDGLVCRETDGKPICQQCSRDNQCPTRQECKEEETEESGTGLCKPKPPACPKDGYGDNHEQPDAKEIKQSQFPFKAIGGMNDSKPVICRNPSSNMDYSGNNGDWWKFTASTPKVIDVTVRYNQDKAGDVNLQLINSVGSPIVSSIRPPSEEQGKERLVYGVTQSNATFFLHVTQALKRGVTSAEYELEVDVRDPRMCNMDGKEENDDRMNAASLQAGMQGSFNVCGGPMNFADKDFYSLDANANQNVTVTATGVPERLGQITMILKDPKTGNSVIERGDSSGKIVLKLSTQDASKLLLEVRLTGNRPGRVDYNLEWSQSANQCYDQFETNDSCPSEAHQLQRTTSKKTYSNLSVCTDDDYYAIDLFPRDTIKLESVYTQSGRGIMTMTMFGPNSCATKTASAQQKSGPSPSEEKLVIDYQVPSSGGGTYYVNINRPQGPKSIPHNLSVNINPGPKCNDDSLEDNDSMSGATTLSRSNITKGGSDSFFLNQKICDSDEDWYCVDAQNGDTLEWGVEFTHSQGNLDAFIHGPGGSQKKSATSTSDNETVSYTTQQSGTHCLRVKAAGVTRNDYDVFGSVNGQPSSSCPDIYEDNDSCSDTSNCSAATPAVDSTSTGLLSCSGDEDWYKTCVKAGESLDVTAKFKDTEGNIDMFMYEPDDLSSKSTVPGTDGTSSNNDESISVTSTKDQCYYYNVKLQSQSKNGYDLDVQTSGPPACPDDGDEDNDSNSNATRVDVPGQYITRHKCEGDVDWYKFDLNGGQKFEAFVNHDVDDGDIDLELYESGSFASPAASSSTTSDDESVTLSSPNGTTYFLKIFTKNRSRFSYDLLLYQDLNGDSTFQDDEGPEDRQCPDEYENNDSSSEAASAKIGTSTNLQMCVPSPTAGADEDWYEVWVPQSATIDAKALFTHADGDINMELFRQTSSGPSSVDSSSTTSDNESVSATNSSNGSNYLIKVTGTTSSSLGFRNAYDLDVSITFGTSCPEDSIGSSGSGNFQKSDAHAISSPKDFDDKVGGSADGLMLCENKEDWFKFTPSSSGTAKFAIEHTSDLGEINIELLDNSGNRLGTVTEKYTKNVKVAEYGGLSASTTYYVRVYPPSGTIVRNPYDMWTSWSGNTPAEPWCPDLFERNDEQASNHAAEVVFTNGRSQHGTALACGSEWDWYKAKVSSSYQYHFDAFFNHDSDSDLAIEVRDDSGNLVSDDNTGNDIKFSNDTSDNDEQALFSPTNTATYFFGIQNKKSGGTTNPFQILQDNRYTTGSTSASNCQSAYDDSFEDNDAKAQAVSVGPSLPVSLGVVACDTDHYTWKAPSDGQVSATIYLDNDNVNLGLKVEELDTSTTMVDDQGLVNPTDDNRVGGSFSATQGNTYLLTVTRGNIGGQVANGPYMLLVE